MILEALDLEMRYPGGFRAGPVTWRLPAGLWHLRGGNGSGKTTLMRCLCGELTPTSGTVRVCGEDPLRDPMARRLVGFSPAEADLPDFFTVDEAWQTLAALRGRPDWDGAPWRAALRLPGDLLLSHASRGQRRAAELVAAIAGDPPLLLLDEPFANLDTDAVAIVAGWLGGWRDRCVIVSGHGALPLPVDGALETSATPRA